MARLIAILLLLAPATYQPPSVRPYWNEANLGIAKTEPTPRRTTASQLRRIKQRDGYRCVICGCGVKLEVDHRRALCNGGSNADDNLATLCQPCHRRKTRLDRCNSRNPIEIRLKSEVTF